jgi:hypothetical protein
LPYKDKDKVREYQREYARKRRSVAAKVTNIHNTGVGFTGQGLTLKTLDDLRLVFERITNEVLNAEDLDLGVKGRIIGQLLAVGIKLVEGTDMEHRVQALEEKAELSKYA